MPFPFRFLDAVRRVFLVVLLSVALVSPAVAEVGCYEESLRDSTGSAELVVLALSAPADLAGDTQTEGHCAFGHCAKGLEGSHRLTIAAQARSEPLYSRSSAGFGIFDQRDGPERPPQS
jgi:hypothetical protein